MPEAKRKRASPARRKKVEATDAGGGKETAAPRKRTPRMNHKADPANLVGRDESALAEGERRSAEIRPLEAEAERPRETAGQPSAPALQESVPGDAAPDDSELAEALRLSGLRPEDILTHYNHGGGRVVLVPKRGDRMVVTLGGQPGREEVP